MVYKWTDCCSAPYDEDIARCPECGEHCGFWEEKTADESWAHTHDELQEDFSPAEAWCEENHDG